MDRPERSVEKGDILSGYLVMPLHVIQRSEKILVQVISGRI
jgi:hypothetical protein